MWKATALPGLYYIWYGIFNHNHLTEVQYAAAYGKAVLNATT